MKSMLSKTLVGSGFTLVLVPGTAWLIFWSYFYAALALQGLVSAGVGHREQAVAAATLGLCWFGILGLWRLFFHFIHAGQPPRPIVRLATGFAFVGAVQLALGFPSMTVLRPLPEVGLGLALHWGWLCSRGFAFAGEPAA